MTVAHRQPAAAPPTLAGSPPSVNGSDRGPVAMASTLGRSRLETRRTNRVRRDGKFFRLGDDKFFVKGVTYGPFEPDPADPDKHPLPPRDQVERDFDQMADLGANVLRIYHTPPAWFLDLAEARGLKVFLDVAWPKNLVFTGDDGLKRQARDAVRDAARRAGNHPATFALSVVNEVPGDLVRFVGRGPVEDFIDELVGLAKAEAPDCLVTFANYPTTEYLQPRDVDFACFNVYLHDDQTFRNYLVRLQHVAGEKPLMLGEYGIDTFREYDEARQADILSAHVKAVFEEGLVGTFVFSFTDDWVTHGWRIDDWAFGLVRRDRSPKPAFDAVKAMFARVPQTTDLALPTMSVIICSYNGASTVESCLRSMSKIRYPAGFEVVFVDDGSKDDTQRIVAKFPDVRNVVQENKGLSVARNVGMEHATGEAIVYTDSDCEADEDWLYYMALNLVRGGHAGVGGPNFIPDEGSWVADCVGLSPGGPTHVMVDDRTAEHVPGCNMGFWRHVALGVNGFDGQFRKAGDDVDFIWRVQHAGGSVGFAPAGQVWHYRRNTVRAYLNQQRGYGEAEAMLKFKHPDHFNALGASHWRGKIYGGDVGVHVGRDTIYHGVFGTGLFQTMYRRPASLGAAMLTSVEWHLLTAFVGLLGIAFPALFYVAGGMFAVPIALSLVAAWQAPAPRHRSFWSRPLIAYLHWRQPITRGLARYTVRLRAKTLRRDLRGYRRPNPLPFDPDDRRILRYWHDSAERDAVLPAVVAEANAAGLRTRIDSGWQPWDVEVYASRYVKVRVTSVSENHGHGRLTKLRVLMTMSNFSVVLLAASLVLSALLVLTLWPFSRPAVLIPLAWWTMYLLNKYRIARPLLGLIDAAAEKAGFLAIPTRPEKKAPV